MDREGRIAEFCSSYGGKGYGSGKGSGGGGGYGWGAGRGRGNGYGMQIQMFKGMPVQIIDGINTVLFSVHGNIAHGYIINSDLTTDNCYVTKQDGVFAHGKNLHEAMDALQAKLFQNMPLEARIAAFMKAYPTLDTVCSNRDLYDWHHRLTGSCDMGRKQFQNDHGLSLDDSITVREFIGLTENEFGGSVILALKEAYG